MNAAPRTTQIPIGPLVAALGALLLIVSLFLDWYEQVSGFTIFEFLDLLLLGLAVATLVALAAAMGLLRPAFTPAHGLAVALLALLVVCSQLINDPPLVANAGEVDKDIGIWLALAGTTLMVAGAVLSTARLALAVEPRTTGSAEPARPPGGSEEPTVRSEPPSRP